MLSQFTHKVCIRPAQSFLHWMTDLRRTMNSWQVSAVRDCNINGLGMDQTPDGQYLFSVTPILCRKTVSFLDVFKTLLQCSTPSSQTEKSPCPKKWIITWNAEGIPRLKTGLWEWQAIIFYVISRSCLVLVCSSVNTILHTTNTSLEVFCIERILQYFLGTSFFAVLT